LNWVRTENICSDLVVSEFELVSSASTLLPNFVSEKVNMTLAFEFNIQFKPTVWVTALGLF
jgi:hypothetical protein